jgi:hypothetical protein
MTVTPRGIHSAPVGILRTMLSNCASFQKLVQASSAANALPKIVPFGQSGEGTRPLALINLGDVPRESTSRGRFAPSGNLHLTIEAPLRYDAAITGATSKTVFACASLVGLSDDFFNGLALTMLDGDLDGQTDTVSDFGGTTGTLTLAAGLTDTPALATHCRVAPANIDDALTFFMNTVGDIQAELEGLSGLGGYLGIRSIRMGDYGRPAQDDEKDSYAGVVLDIVCGA